MVSQAGQDHHVFFSKIPPTATQAPQAEINAAGMIIAGSIAKAWVVRSLAHPISSDFSSNFGYELP